MDFDRFYICSVKIEMFDVKQSRLLMFAPRRASEMVDQKNVFMIKYDNSSLLIPVRVRSFSPIGAFCDRFRQFYEFVRANCFIVSKST